MVNGTRRLKPRSATLEHTPKRGLSGVVESNKLSCHPLLEHRGGRAAVHHAPLWCGAKRRRFCGNWLALLHQLQADAGHLDESYRPTLAIVGCTLNHH